MKPAVFVEKTSYRRRRLIDAIRFLPIFGAFLFLLPLFWGGGVTSRVSIYVFAAWAILVAISAILSMAVGDTDAKPGPEDTGGA